MSLDHKGKQIAPDIAPVGTRWLVIDLPNHGAPIYGVTIAEWSPAYLAVKLQYEGAGASWTKNFPYIEEQLSSVNIHP